MEEEVATTKVYEGRCLLASILSLRRYGRAMVEACQDGMSQGVIVRALERGLLPFSPLPLDPVHKLLSITTANMSNAIANAGAHLLAILVTAVFVFHTLDHFSPTKCIQ